MFDEKCHLDQTSLDHLGNALIFMVRYAVGRKTAADIATTSALKNFWDILPEVTRCRIVDEIQDGIKVEKIAEEVGIKPAHDSWVWDEFIAWVNKKDQK